jgi:hypothetical protein
MIAPHLAAELRKTERILLTMFDEDTAEELIAKIGRPFRKSLSTVDKSKPAVDLHSKEEPVETSISLEKAFPMWNVFTDLIMKREGCSKGKAIDIALQDPLGKQLFQLAKGSGLPGSYGDSPMGQTGYGGRVPSAHSTADGTGHGQPPDPRNPHRTTANPATAEETLARLRREHANKALNRFNGIVDAHVAGGMKRSDAQSRAMRENPSMWLEAKNARLPLSHDGNAPRPAA